MLLGDQFSLHTVQLHVSAEHNNCFLTSSWGCVGIVGSIMFSFCAGGTCLTVHEHWSVLESSTDSSWSLSYSINFFIIGANIAFFLSYREAPISTVLAEWHFSLLASMLN